jgi:hypothetical protein
MRCPSNAHGSQLGLVSWLLGLLIPKKCTGLADEQAIKSMRQTIYRSQPLTTYHFILHSYDPNKQCLMDEMPIQRPWESVGVGFLAIVAVDSKKMYRIRVTPSQNP